jgi:putative hydroxymethylpyrimidine transport system substrate-binding protein
MDQSKIARFLKATELATQFIINNPEESWEIFSSTSKELQNELNRRAWFDTIPRFALRPAANHEARYKDFQDFLYSSGLIEKKVPIKELTRDITQK